jgi:hypothetical protein
VNFLRALGMAIRVDQVGFWKDVRRRSLASGRLRQDEGDGDEERQAGLAHPKRRSTRAGHHLKAMACCAGALHGP